MKSLLPLFGAIVVVAIAGAIVPLLDNYSLYVVSLVAVYCIFATGYNLLMGVAGQFDVGQAAFLAIGAYATTLLQTRLALPFPLALPLGALVAVVFGIAIGVIVLRLRHFYLALVTLAFNQTIVLAIVLWDDMTNGYQGLSVPRLLIPGTPRNLGGYLVCVAIAAAMVLAARNIAVSRLGSAWRAIRESEIAARTAGIDLVRYRLIAYAVSAFYGGIAGGLLATLLSHITPEAFGTFETIKVLAMIVVGGLGSLLGSLIGAVVLTLGPELLRFSQQYQEIGFGVLLLGSVLLMPRGIAGLLHAVAERLRWPLPWSGTGR
jgi:branched-chain amino acid transport system permease protein